MIRTLKVAILSITIIVLVLTVSYLKQRVEFLEKELIDQERFHIKKMWKCKTTAFKNEPRT